MYNELIQNHSWDQALALFVLFKTIGLSTACYLTVLYQLTRKKPLQLVIRTGLATLGCFLVFLLGYTFPPLRNDWIQWAGQLLALWVYFQVENPRAFIFLYTISLAMDTILIYNWNLP